jgi:hypothetical protein
MLTSRAPMLTTNLLPTSFTIPLVLLLGCYATHGRDVGPIDSSPDARSRDSAVDSRVPADTTPPRDTSIPSGSCRPGELVRCGVGDEGFRACSPAGNWCRCNAEYDMGTPGEWSGCRGSGVWVCEDLVADAPCYWQNHPRCQRNTDCAGAYYTCNADCPAPGSADRCVCEIGGPDGWDGCSRDGCGVCERVLEEYPCYFRHHFACTQTDCSGSGTSTQCNPDLCPPPSEEDRGG